MYYIIAGEGPGPGQGTRKGHPLRVPWGRFFAGTLLSHLTSS